MSSMNMKGLMLRIGGTCLLFPVLAMAVACHAEDGSEWDRARAALVASQAGPAASAIDRWKNLTATRGYAFSDYAGFLLAWPGFPDEEKLRRAAEAALDVGPVDSARIVAFFDRYPPLTNPARARYALALQAMGRSEAPGIARAAWRGGPMSDQSEAALMGSYGATFAPADQDARMDALLWAGAQAAAERQLALTSPTMQPVAAARLALLAGSDPSGTGMVADPSALRADPGYVWQRARSLRRSGQTSAAAALLATRPPLVRRPLDREGWVTELLANARGAVSNGDPRSAVRIALTIDDAFDPGEDISRLSFKLRDDYTSLMWLAGTTAMRTLGTPGDAVGAFQRYGAAARTPGTRSKGFYWAGRAAAQAGRQADGNRYFEQAAQYADQFYGQLALERLGRPLPGFPAPSTAQVSADERAKFLAAPLTQAVREVARQGEWQTAVRFFREIADEPQTEAQVNLVADFARQLGRRDLGVILGQAAAAKGMLDHQAISFPLIPVPSEHQQDWTIVHAITRQESQFAADAVSRVGARGLMQLMPGTAGDQARQLGMSYGGGQLNDPQTNIRLGASYFGRLMDRYGGSWPLAVAAYNAGPGNVNKWLAANGDPRSGAVDWVAWIERIPFTETRAYVQHVLENAVVYEAMNPARASYRGPNPLSHFLGKSNPG